MGTSWSTLEVGQGPDKKTVGPLTRTDFVRYQGASGDFNPIHHDEEFAQSAGFPTVFSVGMLQAGILATYATDWLGADNVRRFGVQFREQVWPGDQLECTGTVVEKVEAGDGDERTVKVELVVQRVGGGTAIKGWATFAVPE
jgi:acyl dehydratase